MQCCRPAAGAACDVPSGFCPRFLTDETAATCPVNPVPPASPAPQPSGPCALTGAPGWRARGLHMLFSGQSRSGRDPWMLQAAAMQSCMCDRVSWSRLAAAGVIRSRAAQG
jgi:hypothetical protein